MNHFCFGRENAYQRYKRLDIIEVLTQTHRLRTLALGLGARCSVDVRKKWDKRPRDRRDRSERVTKTRVVEGKGKRKETRVIETRG
jgi:hypothetical protein